MEGRCMNAPGFTADASLYPTLIHYRGAVGTTVPGAGDGAIILQGCGFFEFLTCSGAIILNAALCVAVCAVPGDFPACVARLTIGRGSTVAFCMGAIADV